MFDRVLNMPLVLNIPHLYSLPTASGHSSTQPDTSLARPTPPSLNSLLNQGMSLADAKNSKEKCAKCLAALRSNTVPVRCNVCNKGSHQKCSTGPKASTRDDLRKCEKCTQLQQNWLDLLIPLLLDLNQLLFEITSKSISGMPTVSAQSS